MNKTKIDWCDMTWNPVTGCLHGCEYCYARRIASRFGSGITPINGGSIAVLDEPMKSRYYDACKLVPYPFDFLPTFHRYRLGEPARKTKSQTIFVCSMADLFGKWVPDAWIQEVFEACKAAPQHRYLFLTKNPGRYDKLLHEYMPPNMWFGWSQDGPIGKDTVFSTHHSVRTFVSIEPLLRPFEQISVMGVEWVIVGAETGNRKGKVAPKREWVETIAEACRETRVPIFMKESLRELMGDGFVQEFPW